MFETEKTQTPSVAQKSASPLLAKPGKFQVIPETMPAGETRLSSPCVFDFREYRTYLASWLQWKKQQNPNYSGAIFAQKAGLKAHSLLGMVIRGERNLSYEVVRGFSRALGNDDREATYFEKLVFFNQAKTPADRKTYFEELLAAARPTGTNASASAKTYQFLTQIKDQADYLSHWYVVAIREMVELEGFSEDPEWIASHLKNRITPKQARQAIELLLKMGLLARKQQDGSSRLVICNPLIDIDPGNIDYAIQSYHKQHLDLGKDAIDHDPAEDRDTRDFSSLTLSVSENDLERLRSRLQEFRKQLNLEFTTKNEAPTRTVAVNFQSLLLTSGDVNRSKIKSPREKRK